MNCSKCKYWTFAIIDHLSGAYLGTCSRLAESPLTEIFATNQDGKWVKFDVYVNELFGCKEFEK